MEKDAEAFANLVHPLIVDADAVLRASTRERDRFGQRGDVQLTARCKNKTTVLNVKFV